MSRRRAGARFLARDRATPPRQTHEARAVEVVCLRHIHIAEGAQVREYGVGEVVELPAPEAAAWIKAGWAWPT